MSEVYRTFVFYDGNNFYHNIKITISKSINSELSCIKPSDIDLFKLSEGICSHFNVSHIKSFYYKSVPIIDDNYTLPETGVEMLEEADRTYTVFGNNPKQLIEGFVYVAKGEIPASVRITRANFQRLSFKAKSREYSLKTKI